MWAAIAQQAPDIIILDLMLPGEGGLSLCQKVRAQTGIPIVMLTAMAELSDRIVGLELGADDYLTKPFDPRELLPACVPCSAGPVASCPVPRPCGR
jgi:two-component system OmpR family response regulator